MRASSALATANPIPPRAPRPNPPPHTPTPHTPTRKGNLRMTYAAAYGIITLILAPVGMGLVRRLAPPSLSILLASLLFGTAAMVTLAVAELAPDIKHARAVAAGAAPFNILEDGFVMARFCQGHALLHPPHGAAPPAAVG
jgi:hypothetical protein